MKEKSAAILTIKDAPSMSPRGRKQIASWLRRQAGFLEKHSRELSHRFTARYLYGMILIPVLLTGCASYLLPNASQLKALASDTNSIHIQINTIYGTVQLDRNMGGTVVPIATTFKVQPAQ